MTRPLRFSSVVQRCRHSSKTQNNQNGDGNGVENSQIPTNTRKRKDKQGTKSN